MGQNPGGRSRHGAPERDTQKMPFSTRFRPLTRLSTSSCVIRRKSATDSDAIRPPIPTEVGHPFRLKPATL
jgi:hypothetical protein